MRGATPATGPVLGIDPGTHKCGYAVTLAVDAEPLAIGIVAPGALAATLLPLVRAHGVRAIALGSGTHTAEIRARLQPLGLAVYAVDERETTLLARRRYFRAHPPRGWRRLLPLGMQLPPRPIDDFAALLIAERYLASNLSGS